jgi:hypothetical protein
MRTTLALVALGSFVGLGACGGSGGAPPAASPATSVPVLEAAASVAAPDIELGSDGKGATVHGAPVPMDGVAEGLAWPALRAALPRKNGDAAPVSIAVGRTVPLATVLRAVWTLRDADIRIQTPDASGTPRVLDLRPKPEQAPAGPGTQCHLAVFVARNGDLSVAMPGGPSVVAGPAAAETLAHALATERGRCPIRYLAFGAQNDDAVWSAVFDVARAIDRDKSAGDARYVLAEPVHYVAGH